MAAIACAVLATVVLDVRAPGPGPLVQPLSAFALTSLAEWWMFVVEVAALGVALLAITVLRRGASWPLVATLAVASGSLAVSGIFTTDPWFPWERALTPTGWVHVVAVLLTALSLGAAMVQRANALSLPWRLARDRWLERAFGGTLGAAILYAATLMWRGQPLHLFGFWERALLAFALLWCASVAYGPTASEVPREYR